MRRRGVRLKREFSVPQKRILLISAIVAVAFVFRLVLISLKQGYLGHDYAVYLMLGRNLVFGRGFTINGLPHLHHPPLFAYLISTIFYFVRRLILSGNIATVIFGALALIPFYLLGTNIYDMKTSYKFLLLCAFAPALTSSFLFWGSMSEPIFIFFAYLGLFFSLLALRENRAVWYVCLGTLFALAYLVRGEGILYVPLTLLAITVLRICERKLKRADVAKLLLGISVFLVFASPYLVYLHKHTGEWIASGKTSITYILYPLAMSNPVAYEKKAYSLNREGTALMLESYRTVSILSVIKKDPSELVRRLSGNWSAFLRNLFSSEVFPWFLLPFAGIGLMSSLRTKKTGKETFFLGVATVPVLSFLFFHMEARFLVIVVPILLLWTAKGLEKTETWLQKIRALKKFSIIVTLPYILIVLSLIIISVRAPLLASESAQHENLRKWLSANIRPNSVIMSREPELAVYANAEWAGTPPYADYDRLLSYASLKKTNYLVLNRQFTSRFRPQLHFLLEEKNLPPELEVVYRDASEDKTVVYRIKR